MSLHAIRSKNASPRRLQTVLRSGPFRVACTAILLGAGMEAWHNHLNAPPTVAIPAPAPMPVPNAYDDFARIAAGNVEPSPKLWETTKTGGFKFTDDDRYAALVKAAPTLAAFHAALAAHRPFRQTVRHSLDDSDDTLAKFRSLARTLYFEERMREHEGDYAEAVSDGIDGIEFGALVPTSGGMSARAYGSLIEILGRKRLWGMVDHLNAEQATAAAHRLEAIAASRQSLAESMTIEKGIALSQMSDLMHKNTTLGLYHALRTYDPNDPEQATGIGGLFTPFNNDSSHIETPAEQRTVLHEMSRDWWELMTHSKTQIANDTARIMDIRIAEAKLPFAAASTVTFETHDPFNRSLFYSNGYGSDDTGNPMLAFNQPLFSSKAYFRSTLLTYADMRMEDSLLTLAFALRTYRLQHNTVPDTLDRLVETDLLHHLPTDPFATTAVTGFRYRRIDADHFLLYSVGPDGVDNGGEAVPLRTDDKEPIFTPDANDKGDWVLGRNTPHTMPRP